MARREMSDREKRKKSGLAASASRLSRNRTATLLLPLGVICMAVIGVAVTGAFRAIALKSKSQQLNGGGNELPSEAESPDPSPTTKPVAAKTKRTKPTKSLPTKTIPGEPTSTLQWTAASLRKEMAEIADRFIKEFPNDPDAVGAAGMMHDRNGNSAEALKCWQTCLTLDPRRADVYDAMSVVALKKGEYEKARAMSEKALEIDPAMPGVHYRLARALLGLGEMEPAIAALEKDVEITPTASRSFLLLGQTHRQRKDYTKAKTSYQTAIALDPDLIDAYYGLATVCARLGQADQSRRYMEEFTRRKNEYWKFHTDMRSRTDDLGEMRRAVAETCALAGRIYARHGKPDAAERLWHRAAALDPQNTPCREYLASLYRLDGRDEDSLRVCEQLREIEPRNPRHYLKIGALCVRLKRFDRAEQAFRKVIELRPEASTGYRAMVGFYLGAGTNQTKAKELAAGAVQREPTAVNYYVLALVDGAAGDLSASLEATRRAVELAPDNREYKRFLEALKKRE